MVRFYKISLVATITLLSGLALRAQTPALTEYEVKAAFLYNFAKFVEWPPQAFKNSPDNFVIGIFGEDPFGENLENELNGKIIQDKKLVIRHLANLKQASDCQVVYIGDSEESRLGEILNQLKGPPVLTVSDIHRFIQRGGMVGFTVENNKVRFNINRTVAEGVGLKISSQLLKLAKTIVKTMFGTPIG